MHEFSICQTLVGAVLKELERHKKARLKKVRVAAGEYHRLIPASLKLAYKILTTNTAAEGSLLSIKTVPLRLKCNRCGWKGAARGIAFICKKCGGTEVEIIGGKELCLESIEVDRISPPASLESLRTQR